MVFVPLCQQHDIMMKEKGSETGLICETTSYLVLVPAVVCSVDVLVFKVDVVVFGAETNHDCHINLTL